MKSRKKYKALAAGLLSLGSLAAAAQGFSPAALEWQKEQCVWLQSANAAGTAFDDTRNYSDVRVGYDVTSGNYKRPQQGEKDKVLSIGSEGFINLQNIYLWGEFSFQHENLDDAQYNASITDPFRGMPFYVTDTYQSKWRNQFYNLAFRMGTPLYWRHLTFGLTGNYKASLAAKQRDPRVDSRFYNLWLSPGVTYSFCSASRVGLNIYYSSLKEDAEMSNENTYVSQDYYILYGLGAASHGLGSGVTLNYFGNLWGLGLQYQYGQGRWNVFLEAAYDKKIENVEQSFTSPKKLGAVNDKHLSLKATAFYRDEALTHELKAGWDYRHINGTQYLMKRDNTETHSGWIELSHLVRSLYQTRQAFLEYGIVRPSGDEYDWRADARIAYLNYDDQYILPASRKDSRILTVQAGMKKNFKIGQEMQRRLLAAVSGGFRNGMGGSYKYGGTNADYPTVTAMEPQDEAFLLSDSWNAGASLTYSQLVKPDTKMNIYARMSLNYTKPSHDSFDKRQELSFTVGCNF
ncbi:hypothetical protein C7120_01255 [Prevotella sp. oral taxon 376]|uniref:DUF6850 family outer membrane beta-barrel protein n=1 Tax=Prevotella sp. oral taxon 376 TaxID=712466 RepID=UPI000D1EA8C1|nr:DUF6850 family outer membrane beta-barrel protein [Prevotella sp. oral taxon 376]PTL33287.1 hypothetical protein C7120_01255 [Prevotella sp. oral taxon 376]